MIPIQEAIEMHSLLRDWIEENKDNIVTAKVQRFKGALSAFEFMIYEETDLLEELNRED